MIAAIEEGFKINIPVSTFFQGPYFIGGWSLGGVVAFEMAQQFLSRSEIGGVMLIDCMSPSVINQKSDVDKNQILGLLIQDLGGLFEKELPLQKDQMAELSFSEQSAFVFNLAKQENVLPVGISEQQFNGLCRVFKSNIQAFYRYTPKPYHPVERTGKQNY